MFTGFVLICCHKVSIRHCFNYSSFMFALRFSRIGSNKLCHQSKSLTSWSLYKTLVGYYVTHYDLKTLAFSGPIKQFSSYSLDSINKSKRVTSKLKDSEKDSSRKGKKEIKTYITLLKSNDSMQVTTLEEALKLATRRNYKLIKTLDLDSKTGRPVYKMVTESQYLTEDDWIGEVPLKKGTPVKSHKVVSISSNINEHDLVTKVKLMKKWLEKKTEVRVVISGEKKLSENIYLVIEKELGEEMRILQKRTKGNDIRFQLIPQKKSEQE